MPVVERQFSGLAAEARLDHFRCVAAALLCGIADAGYGLAVRHDGGHRIADCEDAGVAGHAEVRVDLDATGAIGFDAEPSGGRRGQHARGPDDRLGRDGTSGKGHAIGMDGRHGSIQQDFDAQFAQRFLGIGGHFGLEVGEHSRAGLDQHDPRLFGLDVAEVVAQRDARQLDDRTGELHARRACTDDDEGEECLAAFGISLELGALEGQQQPTAHGRRVLEGLEAGRVRFPVILTEIGVLRAGGENEIVERHGSAVVEPHHFGGGVDSGDAAEQGRHLLAPVDELPDRPGDLGRAERSRGDLIQQWLEKVVVTAVDQRDGRVDALQFLDRCKAAKAAAHNHDFRLVRHGSHQSCAPLLT